MNDNFYRNRIIPYDFIHYITIYFFELVSWLTIETLHYTYFIEYLWVIYFQFNTILFLIKKNFEITIVQLYWKIVYKRHQFCISYLFSENIYHFRKVWFQNVFINTYIDCNCQFYLTLMYFQKCLNHLT